MVKAPEIKRIDIVIVVQSWQITTMTQQLCGGKLKIGEPLFMSEFARHIYEATDGTGIPNAPSMNGLTDTGIPVFSKYGLQWVSLTSLMDDLSESHYWLAWVNRQQKRPIRRHRFSTNRNNTKLRYSFLHGRSLEESEQGRKFRLTLKEYLASRLAENCFIWVNPDHSATVNVILREEIEKPRRVTDLIFREMVGFEFLSHSNPKRPAR